MATRAAPISQQPIGRGVSWPWFREFIRWEVAPYPGRVNTVIRMTVTATLVMIVAVTFRIPNAFLGALFSILLARENLAATWRGGRTIVLAFVGASLYTLFGMMLFRGYPITHFLWVIGSLFLVFFVIRTMTNYAAATAFVIPIGVALPLWDRTLPSELQVEGTLWPVLVIAVGAGVTFAVEALYRIFDRSDPLIASVDDLLLAVQEVAGSIASLHEPSQSIRTKVLQYHMIGTGRLRMTLQRQGVDPTRRAQRGALISLAGRLVGLAADLERNPTRPSDDDATRLRALSERLGAIRAELREFGFVSLSLPVLEGQPSSSLQMLQEMERTVALIAEVFRRDEISDGPGNASGRDWWRSLFQPDAFQNSEYLQFAFAGCLSASVCYILYNALDWPGISTCVLTCILTALTTIGSSLQAQFLRLAGYTAGGLVFGMSAQILILPAIDTVFGFAIFFAAVTAIAAWFATSSPRLSYFGVQMALAFYFVNLQDSHIQTDLTIARDKAIGALVGILAMGFIFDRFGTKSDAEQLQKLTVRIVRLLAQLAVNPVARGRGIAAAEISRLRSQINDSFASLESQVDAARFESEFRHRNEEGMAECERIQRAQPALRSVYLLELSLITHRGRQEIDCELTQDQTQALDDFLQKYSEELLHTAAWIAHEEDAPPHIDSDSMMRLQQNVAERSFPHSRAIADICQNMVSSLLMLHNEC